MSRVEVLSGPERRRRWSAEQKRSIVAEAFAPGASVCEVARRGMWSPGRFIGGGTICGPLRRDLPRWWSRRSRASDRGGCAGAGDRAWPGHSRAHCGDGAHGAGDCGHQSVGGAMIPLPTGVRVWIAAGHTDMRRGMQSLALQVQEGLKRDPHAGDLYVFRGRSGSLIKILWHDGIRFIWPSATSGVVSISTSQLAYMLDGIDWRNPQHTWRPTAAG